jgi:hypothetical protein
LQGENPLSTILTSLLVFATLLAVDLLTAPRAC